MQLVRLRHFHFNISAGDAITANQTSTRIQKIPEKSRKIQKNPEKTSRI